LFFIAERLQKSVVEIERMSSREVNGWLAWFGEAARNQAPTNDDAIDMRQLSKAELRRMFG
jgi:hypothetical protein